MKALCRIALLALTLPAAAQTPADPGTAAIHTALAACLHYSSGAIPPATEPGSVPPGLAGGRDLHVMPLPGMDGRGFSYERRQANVMSCGIALYGPVTDALRDDIRQRIAQDPRWKQCPQEPLTLAGPFPSADAVECGVGNIGVILLWRDPGASAPTLEVVYHNILLR